MSGGQDPFALFSNVFSSTGIQANVSSLARSFTEGARQGNSNDIMSSTWSGLSAIYDSAFNSGQEIQIRDRRFKVLRGLGEGGYAFVYLVKEISMHSGQGDSEGTYALKKFLIQTKEQQILVKQEVESCKKFKHPSLLPLLDYAVVTNPDKGSKEAYLLFPVYPEGTVQDYVLWLTERDPPPSHPKRFTTGDVLHITRQIAAGLQFMHSLDPPYAHNDLKLGNVLISTRGRDIKIALMDFGSAQPARRQIRSRGDALDLQEWASQHCSAAYRAPELWDTPSNCDIDERTDVWALGCTVFALMYGLSPFEVTLGEAGGSVQLAVMSGTIKWPPPANPPYPNVLHKLVNWMVQVDASKRPFIGEVIDRLDNVLERLPPDMR